MLHYIYLSRFRALQAGDVIATGTPPGSPLLGEQRQSVLVYDDETMGARWREARLPQL